VHWDQSDRPLVEFTAAISRLRAEHPTFRRKRFFTGNTVRTGNGERLNDIVWLHTDGRPMEDGDWNAPDAKAIGMYLNGNGIAGVDATGNSIVDDHFLIYFNAGEHDQQVVLPPEEYSASWDEVIDTSAAMLGSEPHVAEEKLVLDARSIIVLREHTPPESDPDLSVAASLVALAEPAAATPTETETAKATTKRSRSTATKAKSQR
jgi:glycogen operon protein